MAQISNPTLVFAGASKERKGCIPTTGIWMAPKVPTKKKSEYALGVRKVKGKSPVGSNNLEIHPVKLTWNPKMEVCKMIFLFK